MLTSVNAVALLGGGDTNQSSMMKRIRLKTGMFVHERNHKAGCVVDCPASDARYVVNCGFAEWAEGDDLQCICDDAMARRKVSGDVSRGSKKFSKRK